MALSVASQTVISNQNNAPLIIAVDGTAASGKGTISERLAQYYGMSYMDTGVLYRAVGLICVRDFGDPEEEFLAIEAAQKMAQTYPECLEGLDLKSDIASNAASKVAKIGKVRQILFDTQRNFGLKAAKGAVIDGRDIGTVIFPEAPIKLFFDARLDVRAERRFKDLQKRKAGVVYEDVYEDMKQRDERDRNREVAPLIPCEDSIHVDNSDMSIDDVFDFVLSKIDDTVKSLKKKQA